MFFSIENGLLLCGKSSEAKDTHTIEYMKDYSEVYGRLYMRTYLATKVIDIPHLGDIKGEGDMLANRLRFELVEYATENLEEVIKAYCEYLGLDYSYSDCAYSYIDEKTYKKAKESSHYSLFRKDVQTYINVCSDKFGENYLLIKRRSTCVRYAISSEMACLIDMCRLDVDSYKLECLLTNLSAEVCYHIILDRKKKSKG